MEAPHRSECPVTIKHVYQNVHVEKTSFDCRTTKVQNWFDFTNLKEVAVGTWRVMADDVEIQRGTLPELDVPPRENREYTIPVARFSPEAGVEYWLQLGFTLWHDMPQAKAGHELAWDQILLPDTAPKRPLPLERIAAPQLVDEAAQAIVRGKGFEAVFDKREGTLRSLKHQGVELIERALRPHFWRAPTDNDRGRRSDQSQGIWRDADKDAKVEEISVASDPKQHAVVFRAALSLPRVESRWQTTYTVYGSGDILIEAAFRPGLQRPRARRTSQTFRLLPRRARPSRSVLSTSRSSAPVS